MARRQQELEFRTWGGKRKGAGRKPNVPGKPGAKHRRRPDFDGRHPLHVTLRVTRELPSLRRRHVWQAMVWALAVTARRDDMRVVHVSIQRDHIHLIVEANNRLALSRGMRGFQVSLARQINDRLGRTGQVFVGRYHARVLTSPTMVRNAVRYVLANARHHGERFAGPFDPCSTAAQFPGWRESPSFIRGPMLPVRYPTTFLLAEGWRRLQESSAWEVPG